MINVIVFLNNKIIMKVRGNIWNIDMGSFCICGF